MSVCVVYQYGNKSLDTWIPILELHACKLGWKSVCKSVCMCAHVCVCTLIQSLPTMNVLNEKGKNTWGGGGGACWQVSSMKKKDKCHLRWEIVTLTILCLQPCVWSIAAHVRAYRKGWIKEQDDGLLKLGLQPFDTENWGVFFWGGVGWIWLKKTQTSARKRVPDKVCSLFHQQKL